MSLFQQEYFCAAPWVSMYVDPSGRIDNCCIAHNNIGNVNSGSIADILDNDLNHNVKRSMLDNQNVPGCHNCFRNDPSHRYQNFFNQSFSSHGQDFYRDTKNFSLEYLDLRWNNTCNFACIYCSANFSSLWADIDQKNNHNIPIVSTDHKAYRHKEQLLSYVVDHAHEIKHLYLAGGEPLLLKENVAVLDAILAANSQCRIIVNTNLSQLSGNRVFEKLAQHNRVEWLLSCDAMGQQYEYIRWPGKWAEFDSNLDVLLALRSQGHSVSFNQVIMNLNALSAWDFVDYATDKLDLGQNNFTANLYNMRDSSGAFSVQRMPNELKDLVRDRVEKYQSIIGIGNLLEALNDPMPVHQPDNWGLQATFARLAELDRERNLDSSIIFEDIYKYHN